MKKSGLVIAVIVALFVGTSMGLIFTGKAFANHSAATNDNICGNHDNVRYRNCAEKEAYDNCGTEHQGAIWMSQDAGFTHDQSINIDTTGSRVTLYLQGSVYTCKTAKTGDKAVYACNITFNGTDEAKFPNWSRSDHKNLYRGTSTSDKYTFFEPSASHNGLAVSVNVSSIAPGETDTFHVGINRVYGWGGCGSGDTSGGYATTTIGVKITRKNEWQITPSISTNGVTTIRANQTVTWWHTISSPVGDPDAVNYGYESTRNAGASNTNAWPGVNLGVGGSRTNTSTYLVPAGTPAGTLICRTTTVSKSAFNGGPLSSGEACVTVIETSVPSGVCQSNMPASFAIGGAAVNLTPSLIIKSGLSAQPASVSMVSGWGQTNPPSPLVAVPITTSYDAGTKQLTVTATGISYQPLSKGTYYLRWRVDIPASAATGGVPISIPCDDQGDAGDLPYFELNGGDAIVGNHTASSSNIMTWNTAAAGGYAGGNTNLAVIATGRIDGVVTGKGNASLPAISFASDVTGNTDFGGGVNPSNMPAVVDYSNQINTSAATPIGNSLVVDASTNGVFVTSQDLTIHGTVAAGHTVTVIATGNVFVDGTGVSYAPYSLSTIPRLTVYAQSTSGSGGNIVIAGSVTALHGNYVADGAFYTCGSGPNSGYQYSDFINNATNINNCAARLTMYGTVLGKKIILGRTSGSYIRPNTAAEIFEYGPEVWLSAPYDKGTYNNYSSLPPVL